MHERLGHYRVLEQIGSGGMGIVYLAHDEHLERDVALKVLPPDTLADDDARRRFRREALSLSRLNHPNIATIHDFDTFDTVDVLVMEHIPGTSLDEMIARSGPLAEDDVLRLGLQLAAGLEAAHGQGIVHRDLKPGNVRVTPDGRLKVLDFGLARFLRAEPEATTASVTGSAFAGTLPYMAPEQVKGEAVDPRTDIYAAGAVLYEMATGERVHGNLGGARLLGAILDNAAPQARLLNPRISPELDRIITKALDKDARLRYQSARELTVDLERLGQPAGGRGASIHAGSRRWRLPAAVLGVVAVSVIAGVGYRERRGTHEGVPRGSMAIADFANGTGDAGLGDAIRAGLSVQLQQSQYGNVVSRDQVVDALRRMQRLGASLDAETLREVCVREGIPILLAGTIQRRGTVTRVDARALNPASGALLFNEYVQFRDENEAFGSIDALARAVRQRLGEPLSGIQQHDLPLAKVTTRSLEGLKQYSRAADLLARGDADLALPYLRAALDVDPEFAMAHRLLARVYETLGNGTGERDHLARAYELRQNLTERERRHVEASYFRGQGHYERAVETLSALTALYPGDGDAHYELAIAYRDAGDMRKAVKELETTIERSPHVTGAYGELVLLLTRLSDYRRARQVYEAADRRSIHGARTTWGLGMLLLGEGRIAEARAAFTALEAQEVFANAARIYQAAADTHEGKLAVAARRLEADVLLDQKAHNTTAEMKRLVLLARIAVVRADAAEARRLARRVADRDPQAAGSAELYRAATVLAPLGDLTRTRSLVSRLKTMRTAINSSFAESCYHGAAAELALAEGQPRRAVDLFRQASAEYWRPIISQGLARAYEAANDWTPARDEWRRLLASRGEVFFEGFAADWVLAHLSVARAEARLGNRQAAQQAYRAFLALWQHGDDLPARRAALSELGTLGQVRYFEQGHSGQIRITPRSARERDRAALSSMNIW
jgi:tetratricopeptide (TPR) repeat protein/tRNA A-37 threonylcarbamoyl transferase component Bud32